MFIKLPGVKLTQIRLSFCPAKVTGFQNEIRVRPGQTVVRKPPGNPKTARPEIAKTFWKRATTKHFLIFCQENYTKMFMKSGVEHDSCGDFII